MKESDIVIVALPQSDGIVKKRPVVILRTLPPFDDFLVCGVSTQLRHQCPNFDEAILSTDGDFRASGLRSDSLIRLGFLSIASKGEISGRMGQISSDRHKRLLKNLAAYLSKNV